MHKDAELKADDYESYGMFECLFSKLTTSTI